MIGVLLLLLQRHFENLDSETQFFDEDDLSARRGTNNHLCVSQACVK